MRGREWSDDIRANRANLRPPHAQSLPSTPQAGTERRGSAAGKHTGCTPRLTWGRRTRDNLLLRDWRRRGARLLGRRGSGCARLFLLLRSRRRRRRRRFFPRRLARALLLCGGGGCCGCGGAAALACGSAVTDTPIDDKPSALAAFAVAPDQPVDSPPSPPPSSRLLAPPGEAAGES